MITARDFRQRKYQGNHPYPADRRPTRVTVEQMPSTLIRLFNNWTVNLRLTATYVFDLDQEKNHQCKMTFPLFPNLQSIGNGALSKKEAKANAIIAFLAHLEKRKQVGLFVPHVEPNLLQHTRLEVRRAQASLPDLNINRKEFLLLERMITKTEEKTVENLNKTVERICDIRIFMFRQTPKNIFVYFVGEKQQNDLVQLFGKILFDADTERFFDYNEKLVTLICDNQFLDDLCRRLNVLCKNHTENRRLFIRGNSSNVQQCLKELSFLAKECQTETETVDDRNSMTQPIVSIPIVEESQTNEPTIIELSDDSADDEDPEIVPTLIAKEKEIPPSVPIRPNILRSIVLDGQNIARNSNDYKRTFSWLRLSNAINYFKNRGHDNVIAFLPNYCQHFLNRETTTEEIEKERIIRDNLIESRLIAFTPSRFKDGKRLTNYDDRFILQYAADNDAVVVSNDNFRDLEHEKNFQFIIRNR